MIRINIVAEGQSEMHFVKEPLNKYFGGSLILDSRCVLTSRKAGYEFRGGLNSYQQAKNDIVTWLKQDTEAYVTTMFDFFRLPTDFPAYAPAMQCQNHQDSVRILETAMKEDIISTPGITNVKQRFIPYIQLHEFEALLFTDIQILKYDYFDPESERQIQQLYRETKNLPPEDINHGTETAPSKRLLKAVDYRKGDIVSEWLHAIGIDAIRQKCPHFSSWLKELQALPELSGFQSVSQIQ